MDSVAAAVRAAWAKLSADDRMQVLAASAFVVAAATTWFEGRGFGGGVTGFGPPLGALVVLAAVASVSVAAEVVATALSARDELLPRDVRGFIHLGVGALAAVVVAGKYALEVQGARTGFWVATSAALVLLYEGYLRWWDASRRDEAAGR